MDCDAVKNEIRSLNRVHGHTWRDIAKMKAYAGIKPGTLCRFANTDYVPKDNKIRKILGLPLITIQYKDPITGRFIKKE